jgi:hypothetical protein
MSAKIPIEERFWKKVEKTKTCWLWRGPFAPKEGHGRFTLRHHPDVVVSAHRYSYELHIGPIPKDTFVDRTCGKITCVNPTHFQLRPESPGEEVRFWSHVHKLGDAYGGCWIWIASLTEGYGNFSLDGGKQVRATHYSWQLRWGLPVSGALLMCHKCDVRMCVNPDHLFLGTQKDNLEDMVAKGRSVKGEDKHNAKLTEIDVRLIRSSPLSDSELGKQLGVSYKTIWKIRKELCWKHLLPRS